jgi:hypothetical protein
MAVSALVGLYSTDFSYSTHTGLLASSPSAFEFSGDVQIETFDWGRLPYSMTNKGLRIEPLLVQSELVLSVLSTSSDLPRVEDRLYLMPLNCGRIKEEGVLAIYLRQFDDVYLRAGPSKLIMFEILPTKPQNSESCDSAFQRSIIYVKQRDPLLAL